MHIPQPASTFQPVVTFLGDTPVRSFSTRLGSIHVELRVAGKPESEDRERIMRLVDRFLTETIPEDSDAPA